MDNEKLDARDSQNDQPPVGGSVVDNAPVEPAEPVAPAASATPTMASEPVSPVAPAAPAVTAAPSAGASQTTSGLAVAGLVLGILAIAGAFIPLLNILTAPFAIVGLILALVGLLGINKGKHTGKGIAIAGVVLGAVALVVTIGMYGCAGLIASSGNSSSSSTATEATQASSNTAESSAAATEPAAADYTGTWNVVWISDGKETYDSAAIDKARKAGNDLFLNIYEDGSFVLWLAKVESSVKGTWQANGDEGFTLIAKDGEFPISVMGKKAEGELGKVVYQFEKASKAKEIPTVSTAETEEASSAIEPDPEPESSALEGSDEAADSGEVDPELKEALDSYEAFIDEYVAFMENYKESKDVTSMLGDYASFMQKYADLAGKIDAMGKEDMSTADYSYYIEVTSRCSQKLLSVM